MPPRQRICLRTGIFEKAKVRKEERVVRFVPVPLLDTLCERRSRVGHNASQGLQEPVEDRGEEVVGRDVVDMVKDCGPRAEHGAVRCDGAPVCNPVCGAVRYPVV